MKFCVCVSLSRTHAQPQLNCSHCQSCNYCQERGVRLVIFFFPPVFRQQFFIVKEVLVFSKFFCVTYAERHICSTCSNNTFILQNYIDSSVGKSVSNCSSSALCMVSLQPVHTGLALSVFAVQLTDPVSISLETRIPRNLRGWTGLHWLIDFFPQVTI